MYFKTRRDLENPLVQSYEWQGSLDQLYKMNACCTSRNCKQTKLVLGRVRRKPSRMKALRNILLHCFLVSSVSNRSSTISFQGLPATLSWDFLLISLLTLWTGIWYKWFQLACICFICFYVVVLASWCLWVLFCFFLMLKHLASVVKST